MSGLPDIGVYLLKSATADLSGRVSKDGGTFGTRGYPSRQALRAFLRMRSE